MVARQCKLSLADLPADLAVQMTGHLAATSVCLMDDLHILWVTCYFMRSVCRNTEVSLRIFVERLFDNMVWDNPDGYHTLLPCLAQVDNLEACFITGMHVVFYGPVITPLPFLDENLELNVAGGHKVAAFVAVILLYMANSGAGVNDNARQYMR